MHLYMPIYMRLRYFPKHIWKIKPKSSLCIPNTTDKLINPDYGTEKRIKLDENILSTKLIVEYYFYK